MSRFVAACALFALSFIASGTAVADDVLKRAQERGTLIAAAVPDQLPLAAWNDEKKLAGFDIEVARLIAERLDMPLRFVTPSWQEILAGNWGDRWDYSVSSMTPTKERAENLNFPGVYRFDGAVVVVHRDNLKITEPEEVSGMRIGVKQDTTFEAYLNRNLTLDNLNSPIAYRIDNPVITQYADKDSALIGLTEGEVDAVVTSFATARSAIDKGMDVQVIPGFLFFEPVSVAIAKGDDEFARRIERIVLDLSGDGTLSALSTKWFGIDLSQIIQ